MWRDLKLLGEQLGPAHTEYKEIAASVTRDLPAYLMILLLESKWKMFSGRSAVLWLYCKDTLESPCSHFLIALLQVFVHEDTGYKDRALSKDINNCYLQY